jgi:hypothetical protein
MKSELNQTIQKFIIKNPTMLSADVAEKFEVGTMTVSANRSILVRQGLIAKAIAVVKKVKVTNVKVNNVMDVATALIEKGKGEFGNVKGVFKKEARQKMVDAIKVIGTTLSLPFEDAIIEKKILDEVSKKMTFIGYEWDKNIFWNLCKTIGNDKLPINPVFGSIGEAIFKATKDTYANLILDYCGVLDTFAKEIEFAVNNDIVQKDGIIAITLSKMGISNNTGVIGEIFNSMPMNLFNTNISETELGIKLFLNKILTKNYSVETVFNYRDIKENGNQGMPMILIIVRRIA